MKFERHLAVDIADKFYAAMYNFPSTVEILVQDKALSYVLDGISLDINLPFDSDAYTILKRPFHTRIDIEFRENNTLSFRCRVIGTDIDFYYRIGAYITSLLKPVILDGILPIVKLRSVHLYNDTVTLSIIIQMFDELPREEDDIPIE
ncbi:hypothetical protein NZD89_00135 [Alicyclobacillus fastidiosus]|uniref:Uncharacterized protein n=1 Tax=Alicyclobacillus fastidiosus TaxID=392011 RepID=A0ABY6ZGJ6_9BACL|nr:hypothetical protein [Alicyclobacillus fastidiosus]WAH41979.1 hypothetical protein NZD89_00135 [Alicyclobacillus fastidiosus]GMA63711.1 hypothetical protein GCM10025859_41510 [Alicyclobacillus fastidiosus]